MTNIKAASVREPALSRQKLKDLCADYYAGFCRRGDNCKKSHEVCGVIDGSPQTMKPEIWSAPNYLSLEPRVSPSSGQGFDGDLPGLLSNDGARHQNDYVDIHHINILPTMDEILSRRAPFVPKKDQHHGHFLPRGQARLMDTNFRQLRYENTESLIDICYHASQRLVALTSEPQLDDYDDRNETPNGNQYFMFRNVEFEELQFHERKGIEIRVSFSCPAELRGLTLGSSGRFDRGRLAALIGLDKDHTSLSVTFLEITQPESTNAMKVQTGHDLRASACFAFADPEDIDTIRRTLYNVQSLLSENFILVSFPRVLLAGFIFCLKQLQHLSVSDDKIAFASSIAPPVGKSNPSTTPPKYANHNDFAFKCNVLKSYKTAEGSLPLTFNPTADEMQKKEFIASLRTSTTLDDGQAKALCENLSCGMAFTQGPPGTGKTFLGVALSQVILASRKILRPKPILAVCVTNHAVDSFMEDLLKLGVTKLARLGRGSKESWIQKYQISELSQKMTRTLSEKSSMNNARFQLEGLSREGTSWCESLNQEFTCWPAIRTHLKKNYKVMFEQFAGLEAMDESKISDIRLARKAGGFAFEHWCRGGDIKDINKLVGCFDTMLENESPNDMDELEVRTKKRVVQHITQNAAKALRKDTKVNVWELPLTARKELLSKWKEEVNPWVIIDQTVEIHRRHQVAAAKKKQIQHQIEARCLEKQDVIGLTTTACAMNWSMLKQLGIQTVICEEAGEVMEAQTLCTLFPSVEHAIFIGDPLQLRPQVNEQSLSMDTLKGQDYRLDESLFERMMFPSEPGVSPLPTSRLNLQRRMHPDIADIMRATLYPFLQDHESTSRHPPVAGMVERLWWFDHTNPEDKPDPRSPMAKSYSNSFEVDMVIGLVTYLVETNEYSLKDIAILTPYNGQLAVFVKRLKTKCSIWLSDEDKESLILEGLLEAEDAIVGNKTEIDISTMLRLSSIDSFQGEEAKVIILSTVRSNPQNRIGFLKTNNRINVACSRAREGFYIIGNSKLMSGADMWQKIVTSLADKSKVGPEFRVCCSRHPERAFAVRTPGDWEKIPVCQVPCAVVLPCGHPCTEGCHPKALHSLSGGVACGLHVEGLEGAEGEEGEEGEEDEEDEGEGGKVEGEGEEEEEGEVVEEVGKVGREVKGGGAAVVVDYGRYLHEEAFLEQMLRMKEMWVKAKQ